MNDNLNGNDTDFEEDGIGSLFSVFEEDMEKWDAEEAAFEEAAPSGEEETGESPQPSPAAHKPAHKIQGKKKPPEKKNADPDEKNTDADSAKRAIVLANIVVVGLLLITVTVCLLVLRRSTYSDTERRPLATFPNFTLKTWLSGDFADGVTEFFSDTVPSRDRLKDISASITKYRGISKGGVIIVDSGSGSSDGGSNLEDDGDDLDDIQIAPNKTPVPGGDEKTESPSVTESAPTGSTPDPSGTTPAPATQAATPTTAPTPTPTPGQQGNNNDVLYSDNGLVIVGNRAMEIFGGSLRVAKTYALNLNAYKEALGSRVNVYSMVIPVASAFYYNEGSSRSDCIAVLNTISESLSSDVIDVPIFDALDRRKSEYLYLRTDHHWTALAGYYAWCEFASKAGFSTPALDSSAYTTAEKTNYLGSLYGQTNSHAALKNAPDTFRYYKPTNSYSLTYKEPNGTPRDGSVLFYEDFQREYYMLILGSNEKITEIKTDVKNGKKLAIVKDSFGNMLVPFAITAFEEIYVIDARYFEMNLVEYLQAHNVTDVLFACCAFQASSSTPVGNTYVDNIQDIRIR